jgi:hypothetical protein
VTPPRGLRPCLAVTGSVLLFGALVDRAGFVPAVVATAVLASCGSPTVRLREALVLAAALAAALSLLFVGLLDQPFELIAGF